MNKRASSQGPWPKNRKRAQVRKPTIRWEVLGLSAPQENKESPSIDSIRQAVSAMASRGLGGGVRAQVKDVESESGDLAGARDVRRRGATE